MKAALIYEYGSSDVFKIEDVPIPAINDNEVLVKIFFTAINPYEYKVRRGDMKMVTGTDFPKLLGAEASGIVERVGDKVSSVKAGDKVIAFSSAGTYAEYISVAEKHVIKMPEGVSFTDAACVHIAADTAFNALIKYGSVKQGSKVLINGASGGVGTYAVQIAKLLGADVTAITSGKNAGLVQSLGADNVIDYTKSNIKHKAKRYNVVFDIVDKLTFSKAKSYMAADGVYITLNPSPSHFAKMMLTSVLSKKFKTFFNELGAEDISQLLTWFKEDKLRTIIDHIYTLDEIRQAHTRSESGKAVGKIIVKVSES